MCVIYSLCFEKIVAVQLLVVLIIMHDEYNKLISYKLWTLLFCSSFYFTLPVHIMLQCVICIYLGYLLCVKMILYYF